MSEDIRDRLTEPTLHERLERIFLPVVIFAALLTIPLTIAEEQQGTTRTLIVADWLVWAVFAAEYCTLLATTRHRGRYLRDNLLGALIVVVSFPLLPSLFGLVRLARLLRILRLFRGLVVVGLALQGLRRVFARRGLLAALSMTVVLVAAAAVFMSAIEPQTVKGGFWAGIWWAIVTVSTVGYGDISPVTVLGRITAVVLMLTGIGLLGTVAASIAAYFVGQDSQDDMTIVMDRLERIEAILERLEKAQLGNPPP